MKSMLFYSHLIIRTHAKLLMMMIISARDCSFRVSKFRNSNRQKKICVIDSTLFKRQHTSL
jgi:hypothetical protein